MSRPEAHKAWALHLRHCVPGKIAVSKHYDEHKSHSIDVLTSTQPEGGIVAATVGLMEVNQSSNPQLTIPSEVLLDSRSTIPEAANLVATIAFFIIKDSWRIAPGTVFEEIVSMYKPALAVRHVYFTSPFQWDERMRQVSVSDRTIYPLLAVPISNDERELLAREGANALESHWESSGTDVLDWDRPASL